MKNIIYLFTTIIFFSCASSTISPDYLSEIKEYQEQKKSEYLNNEVLNLDKSEINDFFKINEKYNCQCIFNKTESNQKISIPTSNGTESYFKEYGTAKCIVNKSKLILKIFAPLRRLPNGLKHLFLPIKDKTNGETTYGGGRYVELYESDIKGNIVNIDFNKSYNPYCAFRDNFSCPIPPKENHLDIKIKAGEKYKKQH